MGVGWRWPLCDRRDRCRMEGAVVGWRRQVRDGGDHHRAEGLGMG